MNIIYIHTHDTGRYIEPYGYAIPAPNLMKLAREGVLFRHAYSAAPNCSPSRSALLTGMYAHSTGMLGLAHRGFKLHHVEQHLAHFLRSQGMVTALCGVQHEGNSAKELGYDHVLDYQSKDFIERDVLNAELAANFIKKAGDRPYFLSFGLFQTHREFPNRRSETNNPNYVMPPYPMYDTHKNRADMAAYIESARIADECIGTVMQALVESGQEDHTLVVYTTDHGIAFPLMKATLYDSGIGVSLILKYPGLGKRGETIDSIVSQIDLYPTICELLGIAPPDWLQGKSLLPLLQGTVTKIREEVFAELNYHAAYEPMRCVRTDRYKLICLYDDHNGNVPSNMDDGWSKDFLLEHHFLRQTREKKMLFDLYLDPIERINLAGRPDYEHIHKELAGRLERWMKDTNDPLLSGKVEKPEGAFANKISCFSPLENDFE